VETLMRMNVVPTTLLSFENTNSQNQSSMITGEFTKFLGGGIYVTI
jgi:hypothetical protein